VARHPRGAAVEDGKIAGFSILIPQPGYLLLQNVAVLPAAQGRGIGARLLARAEEHARSLGLPEIQLYTNDAMTENLAYYPHPDPPGPAGRLPPGLFPQTSRHLTAPLAAEPDVPCASGRA
jgi:GNAT superfamily N-acetyltransferase